MCVEEERTRSRREEEVIERDRKKIEAGRAKEWE